VSNGAAVGLRDVTVTFNKGTPNEVVALHEVSLHVETGEFVVIVGGNGSGKSTLLRVIAGSVYPDSGVVFLNGRDVSRESDFHRAKQISFVYQDPLLGTCPNLTLHENMTISAADKWWWPFPYSLHPPKKQFEMIEAIGLGLEDRLALVLNNFSGGQRQAITLAIAFARQAPLILLDEYLSSLDEATADRVVDFTLGLVREVSATVFLVIHDLDRALQIRERIVVMGKGAIVEDIPASRVVSLQRHELAAVLHDKAEAPHV
jgi:putative ABC transport system ATP-binding protein